MTTFMVTAVTPSVVDRLVLPERDEVTDTQARGVTCVWCPTPLTTETAVDMGEHHDEQGARWYPRGCHPCAAQKAHTGLFEHIRECSACRTTDAACEVGRCLIRLIPGGSPVIRQIYSGRRRVPFIAAWSSESAARPPVVVRYGRRGAFLAYAR
jgi:hypothetical protein